MKPITGYKKCVWCEKQFPYRDTLKARSYNGIASVNQRFCSWDCRIQWHNKVYLPKNLTEERRNFIGEYAHKHKTGTKDSLETRIKKRNNNLGEKSHFWRGGLTELSILIRTHARYSFWRNSIFQRDQYRCVSCCEVGGKLTVDHVKPFALIMQENKIKSIKDAENCVALWDLQNGRTLCLGCHRATPTWGHKTKKYLQHESINGKFRAG